MSPECSRHIRICLERSPLRLLHSPNTTLLVFSSVYNYMDPANYAEETPRLQLIGSEAYGHTRFAKFLDATRRANRTVLCLVKPTRKKDELYEPIIEFSSLHREDGELIGVARNGNDYLIERDEDSYTLTEIPR